MAVVAAALLAPRPAAAGPCEASAEFCRCAPYSTAERFGRADAIFQGTVLSETDKQAEQGITLYTVRVDRAWKGDLPATETVAFVSDFGCRRTLRPGASALVTARRHPWGGLALPSCTAIHQADSLPALVAGVPPGGPPLPVTRVAPPALGAVVAARVHAILPAGEPAGVQMDAVGEAEIAAADKLAAAIAERAGVAVHVERSARPIVTRASEADADSLALLATSRPSLVLRVRLHDGGTRVEIRRRDHPWAEHAVEAVRR